MNSRKEFWALKQAEADRLTRLEKWEARLGIVLFPEILRKGIDKS